LLELVPELPPSSPSQPRPAKRKKKLDNDLLVPGQRSSTPQPYWRRQSPILCRRQRSLLAHRHEEDLTPSRTRSGRDDPVHYAQTSYRKDNPKLNLLSTEWWLAPCLRAASPSREPWLGPENKRELSAIVAKREKGKQKVRASTCTTTAPWYKPRQDH
jgi:hypothetical protein